MDRDATVDAAVAAACAVAQSNGVRVDHPVVLADGANVVVHLRPAPLVAKVAATTHLVREPREWLSRELALAEHLGTAGVRVVEASDLVAPRVHDRDGRLLTFWRHLPHDAGARVEPSELGGLLRDLHAVLRDCPVPLPRLVTPLQDIERFLVRTAGTAAMQRAFEQVVAQLPDGDDQPLHGDPHPGNLLLGRDGWTWADLEDTCSGPVAWDLACVDASARIDGRAALAAYGEVPDLAPWRVLRRLHATAWTCLYAERQPRHRERAAALLASWG